MERGEQLLTFIVNGEEFGVDILRVQEIRGWSTPMPMPGAPAWIKGVINIRGDIVPIADLRERLGLDRLPYGATTVVVVLRVHDAGGHQRVMGIIVDAMSDVTDVPEGSVKPPPDFGAGSGGVAKGIATLAEKMITILDVDRVLGVAGADGALVAA